MGQTGGMVWYGEGGEVALLARALESFDTAADTLGRSLRNLDPQDAGPPEAAASFSRAISRLEVRIGELATQARDAAQVVRRFADDEEPTS